MAQNNTQDVRRSARLAKKPPVNYNVNQLSRSVQRTPTRSTQNNQVNRPLTSPRQPRDTSPAQRRMDFPADRQYDEVPREQWAPPITTEKLQEFTLRQLRGIMVTLNIAFWRDPDFLNGSGNWWHHKDRYIMAILRHTQTWDVSHTVVPRATASYNGNNQDRIQGIPENISNDGLTRNTDLITQSSSNGQPLEMNQNLRPPMPTNMVQQAFHAPLPETESNDVTMVSLQPHNSTVSEDNNQVQQIRQTTANDTIIHNEEKNDILPHSHGSHHTNGSNGPSSMHSLNDFNFGYTIPHNNPFNQQNNQSLPNGRQQSIPQGFNQHGHNDNNSSSRLHEHRGHQQPTVYNYQQPAGQTPLSQVQPQPFRSNSIEPQLLTQQVQHQQKEVQTITSNSTFPNDSELQNLRRNNDEQRAFMQDMREQMQRMKEEYQNDLVRMRDMLEQDRQKHANELKQHSARTAALQNDLSAQQAKYNQIQQDLQQQQKWQQTTNQLITDMNTHVTTVVNEHQQLQPLYNAVQANPAVAGHINNIKARLNKLDNEDYVLLSTPDTELPDMWKEIYRPLPGACIDMHGEKWQKVLSDWKETIPDKKTESILEYFVRFERFANALGVPMRHRYDQLTRKCMKKHTMNLWHEYAELNQCDNYSALKQWLIKRTDWEGMTTRLNKDIVDWKPPASIYKLEEKFQDFRLCIAKYIRYNRYLNHIGLLKNQVLLHPREEALFAQWVNKALSGKLRDQFHGVLDVIGHTRKLIKLGVICKYLQTLIQKPLDLDPGDLARSNTSSTNKRAGSHSVCAMRWAFPKNSKKRAERDQCKKCGERGHFWRNCPTVPPPGSNPKSKSKWVQKNGHITFKCFLCQQHGHYARDCPKKNDPKYQQRFHRLTRGRGRGRGRGGKYNRNKRQWNFPRYKRGRKGQRYHFKRSNKGSWNKAFVKVTNQGIYVIDYFEGQELSDEEHPNNEQYEDGEDNTTQQPAVAAVDTEQCEQQCQTNHNNNDDESSSSDEADEQQDFTEEEEEEITEEEPSRFSYPRRGSDETSSESD